MVPVQTGSKVTESRARIEVKGATEITNPIPPPQLRTGKAGVTPSTRTRTSSVENGPNATRMWMADVGVTPDWRLAGQNMSKREVFLQDGTASVLKTEGLKKKKEKSWKTMTVFFSLLLNGKCYIEFRMLKSSSPIKAAVVG